MCQEIVPKSQSDIPGCCAPRTQGEDAKCKELSNSKSTWEIYDLWILAQLCIEHHFWTDMLIVDFEFFFPGLIKHVFCFQVLN